MVKKNVKPVDYREGEVKNRGYWSQKGGSFLLFDPELNMSTTVKYTLSPQQGLYVHSLLGYSLFLSVNMTNLNLLASVILDESLLNHKQNNSRQIQI